LSVRSGRSTSALHDAEATTLAKLSDHLPARRASTLEVQWLVRRPSVRGVREPDVDPYWEPPALSLDGGVWKPGRADVRRFSSVVRERGRSVLAQGEDGESLQTFLVLGSLPRRSEYPGSAELLSAPLESLDFPVDVAAHFRWIPIKKMLAICDTALKDAENEVDDAAVRRLSRSVARRVHETQETQDYFESEPFPPGLDSFVTLAVGVPPGDDDLLSERVRRLRRAYGQVRLYRPFAVQAELFSEHLPRPDGAVVRDYRNLLVAEQLAAMMPIGANAGGSDAGFYVGYTFPGSKRPVRYSPLEASQTNRAGAVLLNGTLGSGKTISVQVIAYLAALRGSVVVDVDPKKPVPDHSLGRWPGMEGRVDEIVVSSSEDSRGHLDPLVVALPEMREELCSGYLMDILPFATPEWQTEIISAVRAVLREPSPCSMKVVDRLLASDDAAARSAGKALSVWSDWGLGKLAFSRGDGPEAKVRKQVSMIKATSLALPMASASRASYDQSERVSVATFKLVIARAMSLLSDGDRTVHKLLVIDEAHVLTTTSDGRRFLEMVIRMGRYANITVVLASQLAGDLGELEQLIGVRFAFRQETDEQARLNLRMLGLDEDDQRLIERLRSFSSGQCLMRGLDGRVVSMRFDPVDPEILRVASTRPADVAASLSPAA
jgi:hypothetical protein